MRSGLLSVATLVAFSLAGRPALAQVTVSSQLSESSLTNAEFEKLPTSLDVKVRPNGTDSGVYFVYARNTQKDDRPLVVELRGGAKGELLAEGRTEKVPPGNWKVVRFAKPAAPPAPAPAPAPAAAPAPTEPPPPGTQVDRGATGFTLTLKLFDIDDKGARNEVKGADGKPVEETLKVVFQKPTDYVKVGDLKIEDNIATLVLPQPTDGGKSTVKVTFPDSPGGQPPADLVGLFSVTLDPKADEGKPVTLGWRLQKELPRMNLAIDGVERVAVFPKAVATKEKSEVKALTGRAARVVPVGVADVTKPTAAYTVRVETDNALASDTLELRIRRKGDSVASAEVILFNGPRDEKLWVDVAEPTKQGLGFSTKTTDWVKSLDLSAARGEMEVQAVLKPKGKDDKDASTGAATVVVDADPPAVNGTVEVGNRAKPKERLVKGEALPVRAEVVDEGGAGVKQVTFVMFSKLQPDGTLPPDAVTAEAVRVLVPQFDKNKKRIKDKETNIWEAELTPPADKKGKFFIAAVAADNAGNTSKVTKLDPGLKVIELVDAVPGANIPRGSIAGIVIHGGLPQPGLKVVVGGPDGKAKAVAETDAKGRFCIPDVLPGAYTVLTLKTDSNKGFSSQADVTVEPEKVAKVTLELVRNKDGR